MTSCYACAMAWHATNQRLGYTNKQDKKVPTCTHVARCTLQDTRRSPCNLACIPFNLFCAALELKIACPGQQGNGSLLFKLCFMFWEVVSCVSMAQASYELNCSLVDHFMCLAQRELATFNFMKKRVPFILQYPSMPILPINARFKHFAVTQYYCSKAQERSAAES